MITSHADYIRRPVAQLARAKLKNSVATKQPGALLVRAGGQKSAKQPAIQLVTAKQPAIQLVTAKQPAIQLVTAKQSVTRLVRAGGQKPGKQPAIQLVTTKQPVARLVRACWLKPNNQ